MKIAKYPVKYKYRIARLVSDVFSLGLAVLIVSVTTYFLQSYEDMLKRIGTDNVEILTERYNSGLEWQRWLALIFPALVLALFAAYIILTLKSHPFKRYNVTKMNAQECWNVYALCASLCKIPVLMGIFDVMYIFHQNMLGVNESPFSLQLILDAIIIAIIIRLGMHRISSITEPVAETEKKSEDTVKVRINPASHARGAEKRDNGQEDKK